MRRALRSSALFVAALVAAAPASADVVRGPVGARLDTFLTRCVDAGLQGSVLVELDGQVILHKGYGLADRERRRPARAETPYHLGSLAKQFTATAVLLLESRGALRTSDSLGRWFDGVPADKRGITIDHLLHNASGLPYLPRGSFVDAIPMDSLVREILGYPLAFTPGERYQYSSPGFNLLAAIVEKASGRRFHDFLRAELFDPAGMRSTAGDDDARLWTPDRRTPSYTGDAPDDPLYPVGTNSKALGAGSIVSTVGDLWKWELALRSHRVLDATATAKLFAPGIRVSPNTEYACAWNVVQSARGTRVFLHAGDLGGFNADMRRLVDERATIVFLSNARSAGRGWREPVSIALTRLMFGPEPPMPPARVALGRVARERWSGRWEVAPGDTIESRLAGDHVWLRARGVEGLSALAGSDSAGRALEAELSAKADTVVRLALAGEVPALAAHVHPAVVEASHAEIAALWRATADSVGAGMRTRVLGTFVTPPGGGRTLVRLEGARGARVLSLDWAAGRLVNTQPVPGGSIELAFVPVAGDRVARYDPWTGRTTTIARP